MRNWRRGGGGGKEAQQCYHPNNDGSCRQGKNPMVMKLCLCGTELSRLMHVWELMGHGCWFLKMGGWRFEYYILVKKVNLKRHIWNSNELQNFKIQSFLECGYNRYLAGMGEIRIFLSLNGWETWGLKSPYANIHWKQWPSVKFWPNHNIEHTIVIIMMRRF